MLNRIFGGEGHGNEALNAAQCVDVSSACHDATIRVLWMPALHTLKIEGVLAFLTFLGVRAAIAIACCRRDVAPEGKIKGDRDGRVFFFQNSFFILDSPPLSLYKSSSFLTAFNLHYAINSELDGVKIRTCGSFEIVAFFFF